MRAPLLRHRVVFSACLLLVAGTYPAGATASKGETGPGYIATGNVRHVATVPLDADSAGGRLVGKDLFVRTAKGVTIYDATNPELPVPKGFVAVPGTPNQEREDMDSDGRILVTGQGYDGILYVIDVRNRATPTLLAALPGGADHTNTCLLSCTWVYGSSGTIVDLRDPAKPKLAGNWAKAAEIGTGHDVTEVRPGWLVTASNPAVYVDARKPTEPLALARHRAGRAVRARHRLATCREGPLRAGRHRDGLGLSGRARHLPRLRHPKA